MCRIDFYNTWSRPKAKKVSSIRLHHHRDHRKTQPQDRESRSWADEQFYELKNSCRMPTQLSRIRVDVPAPMDLPSKGAYPEAYEASWCRVLSKEALLERFEEAAGTHVYYMGTGVTTFDVRDSEVRRTARHISPKLMNRPRRSSMSAHNSNCVDPPPSRDT